MLLCNWFNESFLYREKNKKKRKEKKRKALLLLYNIKAFLLYRIEAFEFLLISFNVIT